MKRQPDWRSKLGTYLNSVMEKPFNKTDHNCALFVADTTLAMTGIDLAEPYRGKFKTYKQGLEIMRENGYDDPYDMIEKQFTKIPVDVAKVGDIVLIRDKGIKKICGICVGHFALALFKDGICRVEIQDCYEAYAVGYEPAKKE